MRRRAGHDWCRDIDRSYPLLPIPGGASARDFAVVAVRKGPEPLCWWMRRAGVLRERKIKASLLHAGFTLRDRQRIKAVGQGAGGDADRPVEP